MSAPATTSQTSSSGKGWSRAVKALILAVVILSAWYFGAMRYWPSEQAAENRLHARAKGIFEDRQTEVENTSSFAEAARKSFLAKMELSRNQRMVDNYLSELKGCPYNEQLKDSALTMDVSACADGQIVLINLRDKYLPKVVYIRAYKRGSDDFPAELPDEVEVRPLSEDGFSFAQKAGPHTYEIRGDAVFVVKKPAEYIRLERRP